VAITEDIGQREKDLDFFGLIDFFQSIDIVPRDTKGKDFTKILKDFGMEDDANKCLIVGDNLKREIENGNKIGAFTVWTKQNLSADWTPQIEMQIPKATINAIEQLIPLVERLNL
jgi:FMN phosphatase YigB (HAD superfamily)